MVICNQLKKIKNITKKFKNLKIIEDCAHVLGSKDNKKILLETFLMHLYLVLDQQK